MNDDEPNYTEDDWKTFESISNESSMDVLLIVIAVLIFCVMN